MTREQLTIKYFQNKSVPEFVYGTWLGRDANDHLVACEGLEIPVGSNDFTGFEYCNKCPINAYCFLRLNEVFSGWTL